VLHLIASSRGGGAAHVRDLAIGLDSDCYLVEVIMPEDAGNVQAADLTAHGVQHHAVDMAAGPSLGAVRQIRGLIDGVDILHLHGARAALYGRLALLSLPRRRRPAVVFTVHGFAAPHYGWLRRTALLTVERLLSPLVDRVIAVCHDEKRNLVEARVAREEQVVVIWNGIDLAEYARPDEPRESLRCNLGLPVDVPVLTMVCRLYRPRDFETLLAGFAAVLASYPDARLLIVGDGPYRPDIERRIVELQLGARASVLGFCRDVARILAASDVFVLSTASWEGLPLTVLEAMAAGLPVVASEVGGIPEALRDGETGWVVPQHSPEELARALTALLADPARARRMGAEGYRRVRERFARDRMVAETARVYESLLSGTNKEQE